MINTGSWFWNPVKQKPTWYIKVLELGGNQPLILTLTVIRIDPRTRPAVWFQIDIRTGSELEYWKNQSVPCSLFTISFIFQIFLIFSRLSRWLYFFSIYFRLSEKFPDFFGLPFWFIYFFKILNYVPSFPDFLRFFYFQKNKFRWFFWFFWI